MYLRLLLKMKSVRKKIKTIYLKSLKTKLIFAKILIPNEFIKRNCKKKNIWNYFTP